MTNVGTNNYQATSLKPEQLKINPAPHINEAKKSATVAAAPHDTQDNHVVLSEEAKALAASPKGEKEIGDKVESFTHGVLGMDNPNEKEVELDDSYSAGQFLKGALTVGALLLAVV